MLPKKRIIIWNKVLKRKKAKRKQFCQCRINFGKKSQDIINMCGIKLYVILKYYSYL